MAQPLWVLWVSWVSGHPKNSRCGCRTPPKVNGEYHAICCRPIITSLLWCNSLDMAVMYRPKNEHRMDRVYVGGGGTVASLTRPEYRRPASRHRRWPHMGLRSSSKPCEPVHLELLGQWHSDTHCGVCYRNTIGCISHSITICLQTNHRIGAITNSHILLTKWRDIRNYGQVCC